MTFAHTQTHALALARALACRASPAVVAPQARVGLRPGLGRGLGMMSVRWASVAHAPPSHPRPGAARAEVGNARASGSRGCGMAGVSASIPASGPASTASTAGPSHCSSAAPASSPEPTPAPRQWLTRAFWSCKHTWRRAGINTFRCLIGCSIGDLGTMAYLMAYHPDIEMGTSMVLSMSAGITTSILLETTLLHLGKDRLPWSAAAKTAMGMSLVSMIAMEFTENMVTLGLADASTSITSPAFWGITALSMAAGFVAPLPYNYIRLKMWGKACH